MSIHGWSPALLGRSMSLGRSRLDVATATKRGIPNREEAHSSPPVPFALSYLLPQDNMIPAQMPAPIPILERAFQIAREGGCRGWCDVVSALKREGYAGAELNFSAPLLRKQINRACDQANDQA